MEKSPFAITNIRLFIAFRVFFNARFYYPVFTVLFLDFGLSLEQFALLNTVWAITIVCAEVPCGALADLIGRKYLIVATALVMVAEMALLALVPLGNMTVVFWVFLFNRVLSGLAEAMASGADEAIAYDSLVAEGNPDQWPKVLSLQLRLQSLCSVVTLTLGALVYDPELVNRLLDWGGSGASVSQQVTMRFPIYLTLGSALLATIAACRMEERRAAEAGAAPFKIARALRITWEAARWIGRTPFALAVILFGMWYDHVLRMIATLTSQYFRMIELPEASFGLIGATIALFGLITPKIAEHMAARYSPAANLLWVTGLSLLGLLGLTGFFPYWGVVPMAIIFTTMMLVSFFTSHYLNRVTASDQRATVLSFKALAFNLAYGSIGLLFALLIGRLRGENLLAHPGWTPAAVEQLAFREAIGWFPWYLALGCLLTLAYCLYRRPYSGKPGPGTAGKRQDPCGE